jgi:hypothetical protein
MSVNAGCCLLQCMSPVRHEADFPRSLLQVRYQVKSGRQVLKTSLSAFDPSRTSGFSAQGRPTRVRLRRTSYRPML